jgi:hypothetical protein
LLDLIIPTL